ncbi:hypothetical protein [Microbulbifer sp. TYP-18]|uniref:hypothetical protein n=1 Tax=Microbulbifer sp. TYP-18 TaxID=3230024 RepID=UPI0034C5D84E
MSTAGQWRWMETDYPATRRAMGRDRKIVTDRELEQQLAELFPGAAPEDVEDFMRNLQRFGRQAAPYAVRALSGAVQGGLAGAVGGVPGIVAGAVLGGAAGALTTPRGGAARQAPTQAPPTQVPRTLAPPIQQVPRHAPAPQARTPHSPPAGQMSPQLLGGPGPFGAAPAPPTAAAQPAGAQQALQQLLLLLSRPETQLSLLGLLMGRNHVSLGASRVPAIAFASAIAELAGEVAAGDLPAADQSFFLDDTGEPRCDLADPAQRTQLLIREVYQAAQRQAAETGH